MYPSFRVMIGVWIARYHLWYLYDSITEHDFGPALNLSFWDKQLIQMYLSEPLCVIDAHDRNMYIYDN